MRTHHPRPFASLRVTGLRELLVQSPLYGGRLEPALILRQKDEGMGVFFHEGHPTFSVGLPSSRNIAAPKKLTVAKTEKGI